MISVHFNGVCVVEMEATLKGISELFSKNFHYNTFNTQVATFIGNAIGYGYLPKVYHDSHRLEKDALRVQLTSLNNYVSLLKGTYAGRCEVLLSNASPTALASYAPELDKLRSKTGKIVRFKYNGGSHSGVRVVKLEEVVGTGSDVVLKGRDLAHGIDSNAFRAYNLSKVSGEIEVLN